MTILHLQVRRAIGRRVGGAANPQHASQPADPTVIPEPSPVCAATAVSTCAQVNRRYSLLAFGRTNQVSCLNAVEGPPGRCHAEPVLYCSEYCTHEKRRQPLSKPFLLVVVTMATGTISKQPPYLQAIWQYAPPPSPTSPAPIGCFLNGGQARGC
jgi:hypothetical protein